MIELTERDKELGCLIEKGMTQEQVNAEREICELVQRLEAVRSEPDQVAAINERIAHLKTIRGTRHIKGSGELVIPIELLQNGLGFPWNMARENTETD